MLKAAIPARMSSWSIDRPEKAVLSPLLSCMLRPRRQLRIYFKPCVQQLHFHKLSTTTVFVLYWLVECTTISAWFSVQTNVCLSSINRCAQLLILKVLCRIYHSFALMLCFSLWVNHTTATLQAFCWDYLWHSDWLKQLMRLAARNPLVLRTLSTTSLRHQLRLMREQAWE